MRTTTKGIVVLPFKLSLFVPILAIGATSLPPQLPNPHHMIVSPRLTLRAAVEQANKLGGVNYIEIPAGIYSTKLDENGRGQLVVRRGEIIIHGTGADMSTIDGSKSNDRIFHVQPGAQLTLANLELTGGRARWHLSTFPDGEPGVPVGDPGGAIYNQGILTITHCKMTSNATTDYHGFQGGDGGAVYNNGLMRMDESSILLNSCGTSSGGYEGGNGGGIYNNAVAVLKNSRIFANTAGSGYGGSLDADVAVGGKGGGIFNYGTLTMYNCNVANNVTGPGANGGDGGGLHNAGRAILKQCLFERNNCNNGGHGAMNSVGGNGGSGGGVYNIGILIVKGCSFHANKSGSGGHGGSGFETSGSGGNGGGGGGFANEGYAEIQGSTFWENLTGNGGAAGQNYGSGASGGIGGNGAGILNFKILYLTLSTVSGNVCGAGGPGSTSVVPNIAFETRPSAAQLPPSFPAAYPPGGNGGKGGSGGGVYNGMFIDSGALGAVACTIVNNTGGQGGGGGNAYLPYYADPSSTIQGGDGGNAGDGGGIFNEDNTTVSVANSVIARNITQGGGTGGVGLFPTGQLQGLAGSNGAGTDCEGTLDSYGFNLIGINGGGGGLREQLATDLAGAVDGPLDPLLDTLQVNQDSPPTCNPLPNSPVIDHGNSFGFKTDQRAQRRTVDKPNVVNASGSDCADIGAVEFQ